MTNNEVETDNHPILGKIPSKIQNNTTLGPSTGDNDIIIPSSGKPTPLQDLSNTKSSKALETQVGGGHYKDLAIQPIEYTMANKLDFIQGNIIKYTTRHKSKNGIEDLDKIIHYAQLAKDLQYKDGKYVG